MKKNIRRIIAAAAALAMCAALTACGGKDGTEAESTASSESTSASENAANGEDVNMDEALSDTATWASTTDVENEVDRAIYKAQVVLPDGWQLLQDTNEGKLYSSAIAMLTIQANNFGADAELQDLAVFADSAAASIKMNNMFQSADTEFGDPQDATVAGLPAVRYDYTVTSYIYDYDDDGNRIDDSKQVYGVFSDRLYVLYSGTDAYVIRLECRKDDLSEAEADFDSIIEGFSIAEDGTAGYEAASEFMASQSEAMASASEAAAENSSDGE